ncbi:[FeFe] hydrogenase H-cluster radical SAM maturase HydE [Candidatus Micrarchaeota archaeon]|nr:[FeFe] hydrogenase H-cluster radical SAM maturase HydE [Candidatus Micrarchaeota archaeon]
MCYAIPGKVVSVDSGKATVEYFGELKQALVIDADVQPGEYVYAQGGVVVGKAPEEDALPVLEKWKKHFFELKHIDAGLSRPGSGFGALSPVIEKARKTGTLAVNEMAAVLEAEENLEMLYSEANSIRKEMLGNACCVHGIVEFSSYCQNNCLYCGLRRNNRGLRRYRMSEEQIMDTVDYAVEQLGFKALVLQSGEDDFYTDDMLAGIASKIHRRHGILIFMSVGERSRECYRRLYDAGAYGALLRFETSDETIYHKMRPGKKLKDRVDLIKYLKDAGFVVATGFLVGLPGQTSRHIVKDILLTKSLKPDMYSFGPLVPHPATPLASAGKPGINDVLKTIALSRLVDHESKILVTTALETLAPEAARSGLLAGGNSLMINTTPPGFRESYDLYPGKAKDEALGQTVKNTLDLLCSLGRAPTDLGV